MNHLNIIRQAQLKKSAQKAASKVNLLKANKKAIF